MDVTELMIGQSIRASDVPLAGSMKLLSPPDAVISHVVSLKAEVVATEEAEAVPGSEPEVIKKGKKEEEAEAEAKKKK
jgi:large subunit ribosomal protein L25